MNTGLDLKREKLEQSESDWVFGAFSQPDIAPIPLDERIKYLPKGEVQRGVEDFMDCATRGPLNILEIKFNWLLANKKFLPENETWLREKGYITENGVEFSDRFIAIKSGTTREGNSLKAPLEAIRKHGLIPKRMLPARPGMTFNQYHNKDDVTGSLEALGQGFNQRFKINYEKVLEIHYEEANMGDPLDVAGYAWPAKKGDIYPRIEDQPNHVWVNLFPKYTAFDNYLDSDGDFIKELASDYDFYEYGYRIYITAQYLPTNRFWLADIIANVWQVFFPLREKVNELPITPGPIETPMTNSEKFLKVCLDALDTDPSTPDAVKDEFGCADTMTILLRKVFPDFPKLLSTKDLDSKLFMDKRFKRELEPKKGRIIISPRTATTNGHVGVWITEDRIASNTSKDGIFRGNYTYDQWVQEFKQKKGLKIYIYEINN